VRRLRALAMPSSVLATRSARPWTTSSSSDNCASTKAGWLRQPHLAGVAEHHPSGCQADHAPAFCRAGSASGSTSARMRATSLRGAVSEKIVPATSGVLVATQKIVKCLAIRGTEPKVNPPKSVPQVAEANAEAELTVALRTAFHSTSTDQADFAMPRHRAEEAL
jgi:hypothetical protein